jgi:hypothetical protein
MTALAPTGAAAQFHEKVNKADNPLTPTIGLNLQDHWTPRLHGSDEYTNAFLRFAPGGRQALERAAGCRAGAEPRGDVKGFPPRKTPVTSTWPRLSRR